MSPGIGVIGDFVSEWGGVTISRRWVIYLPSPKSQQWKTPRVKSNHAEGQKLLANKKDESQINNNSKVYYDQCQKKELFQTKFRESETLQKI